MPTENPKISAYVPQVVYDRFKQFQEERKLSMSQAATELIVQYFGINLKEESTAQSTSSLHDRIAQIEYELGKLQDLYAHLGSKVEFKEFTSELLEIKPDSEELVNQEDSLNISRLDSKLLSELQHEIKSQLPSDQPSTASSLPGKLNSEPKKNLGLVQDLSKESTNSSSKPKSNLKDKLLNEHEIKFNKNMLASRLNVKVGYLDNKKSELSSDEFTKWTVGKDPDGIGWTSLRESRKVYYVPVGLLTNELRSRLL
jgi:hypothetical protein